MAAPCQTDVHLIFPAFTTQVDRAASRYIRIWTWFKTTFTPLAIEKGWAPRLHIGIPDPAKLQHATYKKQPDGTMEMVYDESDRVSKGKWVRAALEAVKERRSDDQYVGKVLVVHMDGSGKIKFDAVITAVCALEGDTEMVLGLRDDPCITMDPQRVVVEHFENFLLEEKYNVELRDAQCGCWGFNADVLMKLPLCAGSYEIELDVLISALESHIPFSYVKVNLDSDIEANGQKQTDYSAEDDIKKLRFLGLRTGYSFDVIATLVPSFEKRRNELLPAPYKEQLEKLAAEATTAKHYRKPQVV